MTANGIALTDKTAQFSVVAHEEDEYLIRVGIERDGRTPFVEIETRNGHACGTKKFRIAGMAFEVEDEGTFTRTMWERPSTKRGVGQGSDEVFVDGTLRTHRTQLQEALFCHREMNGWTGQATKNMRGFFHVCLELPISFAQTRVR